MPKYCCAANCTNVFKKGSEVHFYRFPSDPERKAKWIAAINRKDWYPTEYSWICSEHFVSGEKSNNQFAPNYVPTIFKHVKSPIKRKMEAQVADFQRRTATKKRQIGQAESLMLAEEEKRGCAREKKVGSVKRKKQSGNQKRLKSKGSLMKKEN